MADVTIREVKLADTQAIIDLSKQMGGEHDFDFDEMKERVGAFMNNENESLFVAQVDDKISGYVSAFINCEILSGDQARVDVLVVDELARGLGLGRLLMSKAEEWAKDKGSKTVKLVSNAKRLDSHKFYEKIGYTHTKDQAAFKKTL